MENLRELKQAGKTFVGQVNGAINAIKRCDEVVALSRGLKGADGNWTSKGQAAGFCFAAGTAIAVKVDAIIKREAAKAGLIHVDGKKEFALGAGRKPILVDSFGTLDEDRWWDAEAYANGEIVQLSKEFVRGHYLESGHHAALTDARNNGTEEPPIPDLPQHIIDQSVTLYAEMFERLSGAHSNKHALARLQQKLWEDMMKRLIPFLLLLGCSGAQVDDSDLDSGELAVGVYADPAVRARCTAQLVVSDAEAYCCVFR